MVVGGARHCSWHPLMSLTLPGKYPKSAAFCVSRGCSPVVAGKGAAAVRAGRASLAAAVAGHCSWRPVEAGRAVRYTDQPDPDGLVVNQVCHWQWLRL